MDTIKAKSKFTFSLGECLFYSFWILMSFSKGMGFYEGMAVYNFCLVTAVMCIAVKLLIEPHSLREIIIVSLILLLCAVVYVHSKNKAPLIYALLLVGMKNVPLRKIFKIGLVVWGGCFCYKAVAEMTGMMTGMVLVHEKLGLGPVIRWSFGYPHPNVTQITYAVIAAFILYLYKCSGWKQLKLIFLLLLGNCLVFIYSISYTGFLLTNLYLILSYYMVNRRKFTKFEKTGILFILPFCLIFSILGPVITAEGAMLEQFRIFMDKLLNMRFNAARVYMSHGITLFGNNIGEYDTTFALDCSYVSLLVNDGIIMFSVVCIAYFAVIIHLLKIDRRKELAIVLTFLIAGISEPFLFNTSFKNLIFLFVGEYMYQSIEVHEQKDIRSWVDKKLWKIHASERCYSISRIWLDKIGHVLVHALLTYKWIIVFAGITLGIAFSGVYAVTVDLPHDIYVAAGNTDVTHKEEYFLDIERLPDDFDGIVYEYQGKDVPLYRFSGNIVRMEFFRGVICRIILGTAAGTAIGLAVAFSYINFQGRRLRKKGNV